MKDKTGPDPHTHYPIAGYDKLIFLKNFIKASNIFIGDYTYFDIEKRNKEAAESGELSNQRIGAFYDR